METTQNKLSNIGDGSYEFTINYSGRELPCRVRKNDDMLEVQLDNMDAKLQIEPDGSIHQIAGNALPESAVEFIKKEVLGHEI